MNNALQMVRNIKEERSSGNFEDESDALFHLWEVVPPFPALNNPTQDLVDWYYHQQLVFEKESEMREYFDDRRVDELLDQIMQSDTVDPSAKNVWQQFRPLQKKTLNERVRFIQSFAFIYNASSGNRVIAFDLDPEVISNIIH